MILHSDADIWNTYVESFTPRTDSDDQYIDLLFEEVDPTPQITEIKRILNNAGFEKVVAKTKNLILVYVPKSDRGIALMDIVDKLDGIRDKSPIVMRRVSSIGGVSFPEGHQFEGMLIGVKPDMANALKTDEQETLAGIFIATKMHKPDTNYSLEELRQFGDPNVRSGYKTDDIYPKASRGWLMSAAVTADTLFNYLNGERFKVHQRSGSKFEASISQAAKRLIRDSGRTMGLDKWNPADLWLLKPNFEQTDFSGFETIDELNQWVAERFHSRDVIAVSLKQVGRSATVDVYNEDAPEAVQFTDYDVGKRGFVNAMNATIYHTQGSIVIRSFGRPQPVSAEINAKLAQGGKCGSGPLFSIIRRHIPQFEPTSHLQISDEVDNNPEAISERLWHYVHELDPASASKTDYQTFHDRVLGGTNTLIYSISKTQSSEIMIALLSADSETRDRVVSDIIKYASSSTDISSLFIKVH